MEGMIGVGSKITSAEIVEMPESFPRVVLTSENPDGSQGYASFCHQVPYNCDILKGLKLDIVRGATVSRCTLVDGDLFMEFKKDDVSASIVFQNIQGTII